MEIEVVGRRSAHTEGGPVDATRAKIEQVKEEEEDKSEQDWDAEHQELIHLHFALACTARI